LVEKKWWEGVEKRKTAHLKVKQAANCTTKPSNS